MLTHVTLPRLGALDTILNTVGDIQAANGFKGMYIGDAQEVAIHTLIISKHLVMKMFYNCSSTSADSERMYFTCMHL